MKTLSVKVKYAYLICAGLKEVEIRGWNTNYRGKILIHSSGSKEDLDEAKYIFNPNHILEVKAIIGEVTISDVLEKANIFYFVLKNPILYNKPIIGVKGKLGLWEYREGE